VVGVGRLDASDVEIGVWRCWLSVHPGSRKL
jgi:hypothetical protein